MCFSLTFVGIFNYFVYLCIVWKMSYNNYYNSYYEQEFPIFVSRMCCLFPDSRLR